MRARVLLLVLGGYLAVTAVMLAPITNYRALGSASFGSDTRLNIWVLAWVNHAVLDRAGPLFDGNMFYPSPRALAYSEHLLGISVFTLPVYALTRNPTLAYNLVWLLSYLLSALAAHALAWRLTRDHLASFIAGIAYAFCFFRMLHGHAHLQLLWAFWIPLSLLALEGWWRRPSWRRLAGLAVIVLMQILASWYLAAIVLVADALLLAWLAAFEPPAREARWSMTVQLVAAVAVGAAMVWPIARQYTFLIGLNGQGPAEALTGSAVAADYFTPPINTWLGHWLTAHGVKDLPWIWGERTLFLGYLTIALAVVGAASTRSRALWFFIVLAGVALALSMGPSARAIAGGGWDFTPFGLFSRLPGMTLFRMPARFALLLTLSLAVLAAAGAAAVHARFGRAGRLATLALIPLMLGEWYLVDFPGGPPQAERVPPVYRQLAALPARAVVSLPDYNGGPEWFQESDYQYYSTAHWHPIVNGYSRTQPPGFADRMKAVSTFPSRESADLLRRIGVDYVVLHTGRYRDGAAERVREALAAADYQLAAQAGPDYLFRVVP